MHTHTNTQIHTFTHKKNTPLATQVHKAQGGESEVVVLALGNKAPSSLLNKQLLYTAVTRAKRLLVVVSTHEALQRAVATAPRM